MTRTLNFRAARGMIQQEQVDETMGIGQQDNTSITPLIGASRATNAVASMPIYNEACAVSQAFVIPGPQPARNNNNDEGDDNISVLTDCSWMMDEDEEDASSQVAASVASESWTVVTSATDSTTIPTRNSRNSSQVDKRIKRRKIVSVAHDNGTFKRRRKI